MTRFDKRTKVGVDNKGVKRVYVIRRSICLIFLFFSILIMLINCVLLVLGLFFSRLLLVIDEGANPVPLINISIMAEVGSTISEDAIAQAQNDLLIVKGFAETILASNLNKRRLQEQELLVGQPERQQEDQVFVDSEAGLNTSLNR